MHMLMGVAAVFLLSEERQSQHYTGPSYLFITLAYILFISALSGLL